MLDTHPHLNVEARKPEQPQVLGTVDTHPHAAALVEKWFDRLARTLANTITLLDPDVIVFGGGMSAMPSLTQELKKRLPELVFGGLCRTPLALAQHGDSSGVLGAARLPLTDLEG
jgi:fructokinase